MVGKSVEAWRDGGRRTVRISLQSKKRLGQLRLEADRLGRSSQKSGLTVKSLGADREIDSGH